ncbi:MAG: glycosyl transferase family 2 [Deltaproteobacteria bacterium RBG_16_71_12]|nr:MAG: glycosyl transferase family 2 [Deltaproteobacteria bacterium RBG_16_71_12]
MNRDYLLITPVRDEIEYARRTLDSVTGQTVPPKKWIIVDDGSTDGTGEVLADYARRFPYIQVHARKNRGVRSVGPGVIEAFYDGLAQEPDLAAYSYLCKLDLDLDLPRRYFERLMELMEANSRLGTCSGKAYFPGPTNVGKDFAGELVSEACGDEMSVGMTKFYRVACFQQIGGFVREVMWDGIDCHQCRRMGWQAMSTDEPGLRFIHLRPMGSSHQGIVTGRKRHGFGQYFMGTGLVYMAASAAYRTLRPPYGVGGAAMLWGYLESAATRKPRFGDEEFRRFLRRYQWECLLLGKGRATARLDERQARVWRPPAAP